MTENVAVSTKEAARRPALLPHPSKLFVEVTTRCNLRCAMCLKDAQRIAEGDMSRETFARLGPAFPRLDALVLNGIGEPLLHPLLEAFVEEARRAMPAGGWIGFQTNGQLLTRERARSLAAAGVDRICISVDAASPELLGTLRGGARHEAVELAAAALHEAGRERGRPISLGVEFVVMRENLHQLPDVVRWAARSRFDFLIATHLMAYHEQMAGAAAFDPMTDRSAEVHREWRKRIEEDGVDVRPVLQAFFKGRYGSRSPEDQRLVDYVLAMSTQAAQQEVCLDFNRLLAWDDGPLREVEAVFAEAEEIARREAIELRLPRLVPTRARRCDFVEDGGLFVSWDGEVHPCHFLWHGHCSFAGVAPAGERGRQRGRVKRVGRLSLGNLGAQDVLAVWNGPAARAFREGVLRYDYPFCYDCTVALCDFVQGEEFTQDCYLNEVPCGACLWSTGVFQCLR